MTKYSNTTFCIHNGQIEEMNTFDIFDYRKYDHFYGVTYSASRSFIIKYLFYYRLINLIVGIPRDYVQKEVQQTFEDINRYYKINNKKIADINLQHDFLGAEMLVPPRGVIHSKIFLLSNERLNNYRVITGSANLSQAAFSNNKDQFEDIVVSDSKKDYDLYFKRYQALRDQSYGYMDQDTKRYLKRLGYFKI